MKRVLRIIFAIAVMGFVAWLIFSSNQGTDSPLPGAPTGGLPDVGTPFPSQNGTGREGGVPALGQGGTFGLAASEPVLEYAVDAQGTLAIIQPDGQVVRRGQSGEPAVLSSTPIADIIHASFSPDGRKLAVSFGNRATPQASIFDVSSKTWRPLLQGTDSPLTWAPDSSKLAVVARRADGRAELRTFTLASAREAALIALHAQDLVPQWIGATRIILSARPSAFAENWLLRFDTARGTLTRLGDNAPGMLSLWNEKGEKGLLFRAGVAQRGGSLALIDESGAVEEQLAFLTLPSKCAFHVKTLTPAPAGTSTSARVEIPVLHCAVPRNQAQLSARRLPDDYFQRAFFTLDDIVEINLETGDRVTVLDGSRRALDAVALTAKNNRLYFINRYDSRLYAVSLE